MALCRGVDLVECRWKSCRYDRRWRGMVGWCDVPEGLHAPALRPVVLEEQPRYDMRSMMHDRRGSTWRTMEDLGQCLMAGLGMVSMVLATVLNRNEPVARNGTIRLSTPARYA